MIWTRVTSISLVLGLVGCGPTILEVEDDGEGSRGGGPMTTRGPTTSTTGLTTVTTVTTVTTMGLDTGDTGGTLGPEDTGITTVPPPPPLDTGPVECELGQLGDPCVDPTACCSNQCFTVGALGGVCSECDGDDDCAFGCNFGSPLDGAPALCGDGLLGDGCETDRACQAGFSCESVVDVPGVIQSSACSECDGDDDCGAGQQCAPIYDDNLLTGSWQCVDPGSLPLDVGCDGDQECTSGQCAIAAIMGIPYLMVCSECNEDTDCDFGFCVLPEIVVQGDQLVLQSGFCG